MPQNRFFNGIAHTTAVVTISLLSSVANAPEASETDLNAQNNDTTQTIEPPPLTIFFDKESNELPENAKTQIKDIADYLIESGDTYEIVGCSDSVGNASANYALSWRRMGAVRDELEQHNVPKSQEMDQFGDGEDCPSLIEGEPDSREEARRAEFRLNPVYEQPEPADSNYTIFDLFKDMGEEEENTPDEPGM